MAIASMKQSPHFQALAHRVNVYQYGLTQDEKQAKSLNEFEKQVLTAQLGDIQQLKHTYRQDGFNASEMHLLERKLNAYQGLLGRFTTGDYGPKPTGAAELNPGLKQGMKNLSKWDLDGSGKVDNVELDQALKSTKKPTASATIVALSMHRQEVVNGGRVHTSTLNKEFEVAKSLDRPGVTNKPLQSESFDPSKIKQHLQGSCAYLSAMIGMKPETLRSMVHDNRDGTYRVNFKNGPSVTVNEPSRAELMLYSEGANHERWPAILEKAVGKALSDKPQFPGSKVAAGNFTNPAEVMGLMTGKSSEDHWIHGRSLNQVSRDLSKRLAGGGPVVASSLPAASDRSNQIAPQHAYAVVKYDEAAQRVYLRNPWGNKSVPNGDSFSLPLSEFVASFQSVTSNQLK